MVFQSSTTERLQCEAQSESQLRHKPITQKNVSFELTGKHRSLQSTNRDTSAKDNAKTDHRSPVYNNLKRKFVQIGNAPAQVRRFVGGISKPNRNALSLTPNSSILKTCPCTDTLCKFAWHCPGFKALPLPMKMAFVKDEKPCRTV